IRPVSRRKQAMPFSRFLYGYRNLVERSFNKLKHYRAIATRFEKRAENDLALVNLAATQIWLRCNEAVT
ncbi:MAG: transposase, partial [Pseudomonadota bacterium]